jgi:signal transduction histidine kinase/DNA-binding NarL/FixJ family response regulator
MSEFALTPAEVEDHRARRHRALSVVEIPLLRLIGSVFLSLGVYLNNRYFLQRESMEAWERASVVLAAYAVVSWILIAGLYDRVKLTDLFLALDLAVWTYAIYLSGGERSWLFFVLLMRVADQTPTTFRRCLAFAGFGTLCYAAMMLWVILGDGRAVAAPVFFSKLAFIALGGLYIALTARGSESRTRMMAAVIRMSRDLIRQLGEARARAEEASEAKSEFLANMSLELRTPLLGVIGMLQLAADGETSPERLRQIEMARRSAETLLETIEEVLDFSRIEARKLDLEPVYFSVRAMMSETMDPLGVTASLKGLALSYLVTPDVPESVWGDPARLRQILVNLAGNAIKFTAAGEVAVRLSTETREEQMLLRFQVEDTGIGIEPEMQKAIFEPFAQADASRTRRHSGSGLGLAIAQRLVEAMGGWIELTSEPGHGSTFSFVVPTEPDFVAGPPARRPWESALAGLSILVVDRHERARSFVAEMLRSRGVFATACASWEDAPDGRFACAVAEDPRGRVTPVVTLTHPVSERMLIDAVGSALGLHEQTPEIPHASEPARLAPLRILVAEDDAVGQEIAFEALERLGHRVTVVSNGAEALAVLERERFDLVLMDVQMPEMDGLEATRRFRDREPAREGRTPVVALTAHARPEDRDRCVSAGMDWVLTTPVDRRELLALLERVPRRTRVSVSVRVRKAFDEQTPQLMQTLREAIEQHDPEGVHRAAHKLKGSVSNFPGNAATALAARIESAPSDFAAAAALLPELEAAIYELRAALTT